MFDGGSLEFEDAEQKIIEVDKALKKIFTLGEGKAWARGK